MLASSRLFSQILLLSFISASSAVRISELPLTVTQNKAADGSLTFALNFFYTQSADVCSTPQQIDFSYANVLIGDNHDLGWGIECSEATQCTVLDPHTKSDRYKKFGYTYMEGEVTTWLVKGNPDSDSQLKLDFRYIKSIAKEYESKWGVVGLSPSSTIMEQLRKVYGDLSLTMAFNQMTKNSDGNLTLFLNHEQSGLIVETESLRSDRWVVKAGTVNSDNIALCLNVTEDYLLNDPDADKTCADQIKKACDGKESCAWSAMNLSKADEIEIKINNSSLTFAPSDYLYNNNEQPGCRLSAKKLLEGCDASFGRFAVQKYPVVLSYNDKPSVQFLSYFHHPQNFQLITFIIIAAVLCVLVFIFVAEMTVWKIKRSEPIRSRDAYVKMEDA